MSDFGPRFQPSLAAILKVRPWMNLSTTSTRPLPGYWKFERRGTGAGLEHSDSECGGLKSVTEPEMCRLIEANGWSLKRINGSHHIYAKSGERKIISVPVHRSKNLTAGLARRIARDEGVDI